MVTLRPALLATLTVLAACDHTDTTPPPPAPAPSAVREAPTAPPSKPVPTATSHPAGDPTMSLYDLDVKTLEGENQPLSAYKGKVALVVNVASECGYTPQYEGLEKLYGAYKGKGLVLLGFPSNDFGGQEPGDGKQIRAFCSSKFHVTFPMFEKVETKGEGQSPVYAFLAAKNGEPQWNFHKYLVAKDGHVLAAYPSKVEPDSKQLKDAIDAALTQ